MRRKILAAVLVHYLWQCLVKVYGMLEIHLVLSEVTCLVPANGQNGSTVNKTNFLNKTSKLEKKENFVFKKSEITDKSDTHGNIFQTDVMIFTELFIWDQIWMLYRHLIYVFHILRMPLYVTWQLLTWGLNSKAFRTNSTSCPRSFFSTTEKRRVSCDIFSRPHLKKKGNWISQKNEEQCQTFPLNE